VSAAIPSGADGGVDAAPDLVADAFVGDAGR